MHICVIMEKSHFALRVNLAFKVNLQAIRLLNVLPWFTHEPNVVLDKVTSSSSEGLQMFGPSDLFLTDFPFLKITKVNRGSSMFNLMPDKMALSFRKIDAYSYQKFN